MTPMQMGAAALALLALAMPAEAAQWKGLASGPVSKAPTTLQAQKWMCVHFFVPAFQCNIAPAAGPLLPCHCPYQRTLGGTVQVPIGTPEVP